MKESGEFPGRLDRLHLSAHARDVYARIAEGELILDPADEPALSELLDCGLIGPSPFVRGRYTPHNLALVERSIVQWGIEDLRGRLEKLGQVPDLLADLVTRTGPQTVGGIERLSGIDEANDALTRMVGEVEDSFWTAHPVDRPASSLNMSIERDLAMVRRGLEFRTIYPNSARVRDPETRWVATMTAAGAEVRTRVPDYLRMIIVDGKSVVIEAPSNFSDVAVAFYITQPVVVSLIASFYEQVWARSEPWRAERRLEDGGLATTPDMRAFIRMLMANMTRSEIARKVGTSERSLTNLLNRIYQASGTTNLVALGAWWAHSPDKDHD
ncbi:hypothetical protein ABT246_24860 [Streptomyces sp. NPDC001553]|uniref:hypothetical protein n=1 Tax=Streptomyces sp. NPDC001553 TaxID=3154385 RepID=UPI003333EEE9